MRRSAWLASAVDVEVRVLSSRADVWLTVRLAVALVRRSISLPRVFLFSVTCLPWEATSYVLAISLSAGSHGLTQQDHIGVPLTFEVPMNDSLHELEASPMKVIKELVKYFITGQSMLSLPFQASTTLLASRLLDNNHAVSTATPQQLDGSLPENRPDIEIMHLTNNSTDYDIPNKGIFTLLVAHIRPLSHGSVRLATSNPRARPDVDLGYFSNPDDYIAPRKGIRLAMRVAADVREAGYPLQDLIVPGKDADDAALDAFVRANLRTCFHYTSTCRMGAEAYGVRPSVVDTQLRVHGVRGLRVCDASVFPEIVATHTMAPTVMVAERCADFIKEAAA